MIVFKYIILACFLVSSLNASLKDEYYFGVVIHKLDKSTQNRAKRIILKTAERLSKTLDKKFNIVFMNEKTLLEDFKRFEQINGMIIFSSFYLKNKEEIKKNSINPFLFYNESNQKTQYYLIANKISEINSIKDLKNKSYSSLSIDDNYTTWLDYLTRKELGISYKKIINKEKSVHKNERLLLDVYFNKTDFTVVSKIIYEDVKALNPAIGKNLRIIKKSKPIFFFGLGLFHKNTPKELIKKYQELIDNGVHNKKFGNFFKMLNLYEVHKASFNELSELESFYNDYIELVEEQ